MNRRFLLAVTGWLVAAGAATATGLAAVHVIGPGITGPVGEVVSEAAVARSLAATPPTATAVPTGVPGPSTRPGAGPTDDPNADRVVSTPGGTVVARCLEDEVLLVSWAPAQGYGIKEVDREPDTHAQVTFEGTAGQVEVDLSCVAGRPTASWD